MKPFLIGILSLSFLTSSQAGTIKGRIVDDDSGKRLPGMTVTIMRLKRGWPMGAYWPERTTRTDKSGSFVFDDVAKGVIDIEARASDMKLPSAYQPLGRYEGENLTLILRDRSARVRTSSKRSRGARRAFEPLVPPRNVIIREQAETVRRPGF